MRLPIRCNGVCDRVYKAVMMCGMVAIIIAIITVIWAVMIDRSPPLQKLSEPGHFVDRHMMPVYMAAPGDTIYLAQRYCHESADRRGEFVQGGKGYEGIVHYTITNSIPRSLPPYPNIGQSGCWLNEWRLFRWKVPEFLKDSVGETVRVQGWIEYHKNPIQKAFGAGVKVKMLDYSLTIDGPRNG